MGSNNESIMISSEDWQLDCSDWSQQNRHLLESGTLADCHFIVGTEPHLKMFGCHKLLLAKASPVFEAMLYHSIDQSDLEDIRIIDITPPIFQVILEYLYCNTYKHLEFDVALQLLVATEKYMLRILQLLAVDNVMITLRPETAITLYESCDISKSHMFRTVKQRAWKMILELTNDVIAAESFMDAKKSTVLSILEQDSLEINEESDLIAACDKWAQHQTAGSRNTQRLRETLGDVFNLLRFLTVNNNHIYVINSICMLTEDEKTEVKNALTNQNKKTMRLFKNVNQNLIARGLHLYQHAKLNHSNCISNYGCKLGDTIVNIDVGYFDFIEFNAYDNIAFVAFNTKSIVMNAGQEAICKVTITEKNGEHIYSDCVKIKGNVAKNTTKVRVIFQNPIFLTRDQEYNMVTVCETGKLKSDDSPRKEINMDIVRTVNVKCENSLIESFTFFKIF